MCGIKRPFVIGLLLILTVQYGIGAPLNKNKPKLEFVTFIAPPYVFDPEKTGEKGIVLLILDHLMEQSGIDFKITIMPPKRAELYAQYTPNTCVVPIEKSQEREVFFSWISPILISNNGFFRLASQKPISLNSLEDARPFRIGSYLGSSMGDYLSSFGFKVDLTTHNEANIYKLNADRIDVWASDILSARYISKTTGIEISESILDFFTSLRAIGCHDEMDNSIILAMRKALQEMYRSGKMDAILQEFKAQKQTTHNLGK